MKNLLIVGLIGLSGLLGISSVVNRTQKEPMPNLSVGKNVVQLNYDWNVKNTYPWKPIPGVKYYYLSLDKFPELKTKMKITSVPTILVLENGKEIKRFEGGMMMKINVSQTEITK
jgi:hypothetical protein